MVTLLSEGDVCAKHCTRTIKCQYVTIIISVWRVHPPVLFSTCCSKVYTELCQFRLTYLKYYISASWRPKSAFQWTGFFSLSYLENRTSDWKLAQIQKLSRKSLLPVQDDFSVSVLNNFTLSSNTETMLCMFVSTLLFFNYLLKILAWKLWLSLCLGLNDPP